MKTLKLKMIVIASLVTVIISLLLSSFMAPPQDDIVGTWISNDDELWKITFTLSGERKDYYENVLVETTSYQITNTCGSLTRSNNELFLKTIGQMGQNEVVCNLFNGIHTDENSVKTLSLTSERGKLYLFTKQ